MDVAPMEERYRTVRSRTVALCAPLSVEDQQVQPMADASPAKWHLAHTTWFFETFVLRGVPYDPAFEQLFNSYYEAVGPRVERARRGMLTRPSLEQVHAYRADVDRRIGAALVDGTLDEDGLARVELGLHHEQQHQELILTDAKYTLGTQPLQPAYRHDLVEDTARETPLRWRPFDGGVVSIGASPGGASPGGASPGGASPGGASPGGFAFDNERPAHDVIVRPFALAARPITNAAVQAFVAEGGYRDPRHWLSDGWHAVKREGWSAPLYWCTSPEADGDQYTLGGVRPIDPPAAACHLSYYEADAIARWLGARLPTEFEWEVAARGVDPDAGDFADDDRLHAGRSAQLFGTVWEWTSSSYSAYPGFRPLAGALGEYNGKFMSGQQVLRGGSCFTPRGHVRATYRNYFPPAARWQMSGARIARDA
ncbi:MAG TPA: ergothioneine biosynthesis protein EgtB [Kofleriaceae bacterium]|nr:ergothioneine biosynthesis protein EgtB [Kofleriaceae bacterium]